MLPATCRRNPAPKTFYTMSKSWLRTHQRSYGSIGTLFEIPIARNTDPVTSHKAAEQVTFKGEHHRKIYEALKTMKDGTFYEIAEVAKMEPSSVWRRLNEMEKQNKIVQTGEERRGPTGRMCRVWKAI